MDALIAVAAVAGLVWAGVLLLRGSLMPACLVFLVINSCFGYYFYHARFGSLELTLDRVALVVLACCYALHRGAGHAEPKPLGRGDYMVLALLGWFAIRTFTTDWSLKLPGEPVPVWHLAVGYLSPLLVYWIARQSPLEKRHIRLVHFFLIGFGVYLGVTALLEITGQWWAVFPRHIADAEIGRHFGRARGPMVQSIVLGFCLSICMLCAWIFRSRLGFRGRLLMLLPVSLCLLGVFFSYTRCVWMGAGLGLLILLSLSLSARLRGVAIVAAVSTAVLAATIFWNNLLQFDRGVTAAATKDSAHLRLSTAYVSWKMFLDRPFFGCGFGQYCRDKHDYLSDRNTALRLEPLHNDVHHNLFLSILVETGLIGLLLFLAVLATWARQAWRLWHSAAVPEWARAHALLMLGVLGVYIPNALFQPLGHMNIVHMLFFFIAGIASGLYQKHLGRQPSPQAAPVTAVSPAALHPA